MIWRVLGLTLLLAAIACGVVAAVTWEDVPIEGAYFNRSIGAPAYSGVFSESNFEASRILLGAAVALAVAGILVLVVSFIQSRRRAPRPPAPDAGRAP
jgi:hypothetical protein